jgi:hypothetical protein
MHAKILAAKSIAVLTQGATISGNIVTTEMQ